MELSDITTDESIRASPHQLFLPGCFVVLQGISGDGLPNTIESCPEYQPEDEEDDEGAEPMETETPAGEEVPPLEEDHFRPDANLTTTTTTTNTAVAPATTTTTNTTTTTAPGVSRQPTAPTTATRPTINTTTPSSPNSSSHQSPDDAFVVLSSGSSTEPPPTPTRTTQIYRRPKQEQAIQEWTQSIREQQRNQRLEWRQQQRQHSQEPLRTETDWWLHSDSGQLCLWDALPRIQAGTVVTGQSLGSLPPGSTVMATRLYTLDSESLEVVLVDGEEEGTNAAPPLAPSIGCIQVLEVQISNNNNNNPPPPVHGYAFMVPGIPSLYMDPQVWWWRVTCKVGAYLRSGLELSSDHTCTIPFGSFVQVTRKTVNRMGLSRLRVVAQSSIKNATEPVEGWCSEFLNPLSGQRGHVVQPLPFPVPAVYRVTLPEGAVIREQVELSSRQIGHAPQGTLLTIVKRQFSEHPQDQCVERLKLAGGRHTAGWISVRLNQLPPDNKCVVELVGVDSRFTPHHPGDFHWDVLKAEYVRQQEESASTPMRSSGDISSIGSSSGSDHHHQQRPKKSTTTYAPSRGRQPTTDTCLICLTEERNATIVHGETGHIACCLVCARILKARGDRCPVCRLEIDSVIQHFWA
ncbi:protein ligase Mdm2 [Seminavis robusta]|uniref:Protein ligase Mdm2 n=1 Tax=Seminavis robusta TaxID=568900 RepID=A0A9N8H707_9STRA|nr:protein ligase Mdm2 [Seminavis robusta]|eukprot:Sro187_g081060.1 protein ligase Mdm2 (633) ;mRNA; f:87986-90214